MTAPIIDIIKRPDSLPESKIMETGRVLFRTLEITTPYSLSIKFMNDNKIQTLNKTYRDIDKPTNVLSFPMDEEDLNERKPSY